MKESEDKQPPWFEKSVDKVIQMLRNDVLKKKIQILVLEPFVQYVIELIFPYVIMLCTLVGVLILLLISILGILLFRPVPVLPQPAYAA
jgi:hypothetical protein